MQLTRLAAILSVFMACHSAPVPQIDEGGITGGLQAITGGLVGGIDAITGPLGEPFGDLTGPITGIISSVGAIGLPPLRKRLPVPQVDEGGITGALQAITGGLVGGVEALIGPIGAPTGTATGPVTGLLSELGAIGLPPLRKRLPVPQVDEGGITGALQAITGGLVGGVEALVGTVGAPTGTATGPATGLLSELGALGLPVL